MARFLLLALVLIPTVATAQDPSIRWGRITDEEIAIDSVAGDPDAAAIVLGDVGFAEVRLTPNRERFGYEMRRHRRVKILRESGYAMGEFALRFGEGSRIRRVKGQTFVPEPDGSMRRVELASRSVLEGDVSDGVVEVRFTMPALAPGAIFEVEYVYESDNLLSPPTWYFQSEEPTRSSEFRLEVPQYYEYMFVTQGNRITAAAPARVTRSDWDATTYRWTAQDLPALREEPYTTTEEDYTHKLEFQLARTVAPNLRIDNVLNTWAGVAEELEGHDRFGRRLRRNRRVAAAAAGVTGTDSERARALYDLVRREHVWNGRGGIFAERDLDAVLEAKGGTAGEINLLLLALLREANVPATPVLLSTRSNGRAVRQYPLLSQFNHLLVLAEPEGAPPQLLDATDPHRPYGTLSVDALSGEAWLVDSTRPEWFTFDPSGGNATVSLVSATLSDDGGVEGTLTLRLTGYDALDLRTRLAAEASDAPAAAAAAAEKEAARAADAADNVDIKTVEVRGLDDPYVPVDVKSTFSVAGADVVGDELYLTPFIVMRLDKNPFERPTREFPVDFAYPFTRTYIADITLPEGTTVADLPEPIQMSIPSGAVTYQRMFGEVPGRIQLRAVLSVAQSQVSPEEYPALRRLYDEIVAAESEAIVVARAPAAAPVGEGETAPEPDAGGQ